MKKFGLICCALLLLWACGNPASAHTYLSDGDITVLLHTNPDDDPIAGQPAAVLFQISDSTGKFSADNCDCQVTIAKSNQVLFNGVLLHIVGASVYEFTEPFVFPQTAVYQITVTGRPKRAGSFQSFQAAYDLRVDRGTKVASGPGINWFQVCLIGLSGIFALIAGIVLYFKQGKGK